VLTNEYKALMIPGPSEVDPRLLTVLSGRVLPHYGAEWGQIYAETLELVKKIFKTGEQAIILSGPGNLALELMAANIVEPGDKIVNVRNGWFGDVSGEIIQAYGGDVVDVKAEPGEIVTADRLKETLDEAGDIKAVFAVQNETSTGVENPIWEMGRIARKHGALFCVDSISSFGGVDLRMDEWQIDMCVGYPSKCLGGINGAVPIAIGKRVWESVETRRSPIPGRALSLKVWKKFMTEWAPIGHPFPTSMPTNTIRVLQEAARLALEEGLEKRYLRHEVASHALREGCRVLGFEPYVRPEIRSKTVTVVRVPAGQDAKIREGLERRFNIMVAGGLGELRGKVLRIATMGVTASPFYVLPTLEALEVLARELWSKSEKGSAVAEAARVFEK
jgi:alanine-glyoxylate transaminase/serine-glyoxylate transaminase/serine-pyruvate transaminase